jgi:hypothetical protein
MAAVGSWLVEGIDVTVSLHDALNKRATNKSSLRNGATNESGRGRGRANFSEKRAANQQKFIEFRVLSMLVESTNLNARLREGRPLFKISDRVLRGLDSASFIFISHCMR